MLIFMSQLTQPSILLFFTYRSKATFITAIIIRHLLVFSSYFLLHHLLHFPEDKLCTVFFCVGRKCTGLLCVFMWLGFNLSGFVLCCLRNTCSSVKYPSSMTHLFLVYFIDYVLYKILNSMLWEEL